MRHPFQALLLSGENAESLTGGDTTNVFGSIGQMLAVVAACIFVWIIAYYFTKWFASSKYAKRGNGNIQIMESAMVGSHQTLHLVRAGSKYILVGVTKDKIAFLTDVPAEDIAEKPISQPSLKIPFDKVLENVFRKK